MITSVDVVMRAENDKVYVRFNRGYSGWNTYDHPTRSSMDRLEMALRFSGLVKDHSDYIFPDEILLVYRMNGGY